MEDFSDGGFRNTQSDDKNDEPEDLKNYSSQAVFVDEIIGGNNDNNKEREFGITQGLSFFAKIGKGLLGIEKEKIFQPVNKILELKYIQEKINNTPKVIKVPEDYKSIQLAIDNAKAGDRVEVSAGEYAENIIMKEGVSVIGANELVVLEIDKLLGGGGGGETKEEKEHSSEASELGSFSSSERIIINETILDGENLGNVVSFKAGVTSKTELAGFTIKNSGKNLSGIFIEDSSPWIHDNILVDSEYNIYIRGESSPIIQKNRIQFANKGIQIYNFEELEGSARGNKADGDKNEEKELDSEASESNSFSSLTKPVIIDNLITDNKIGIDLYQSSAIINHNTISYNNHYKIYLGATYGIYLSKSSAEIKNNIITDSGICELCAGVSADKESKEVVLKYNNIWNNKNNFVCFGECAMEDNNLSEDPLFVYYINGDYRLSEESGLFGVCEDGSDVGVRW